MASHRFIIDGENKICAMTPVVQNLQHALGIEQRNQGNGKLYTENYDVWGTLAVNADVLARELTTLAAQIREASR